MTTFGDLRTGDYVPLFGIVCDTVRCEATVSIRFVDDMRVYWTHAFYWEFVCVKH